MFECALCKLLKWIPPTFLIQFLPSSQNAGVCLVIPGYTAVFASITDILTTSTICIFNIMWALIWTWFLINRWDICIFPPFFFKVQLNVFGGFVINLCNAKQELRRTYYFALLSIKKPHHERGIKTFFFSEHTDIYKLKISRCFIKGVSTVPPAVGLWWLWSFSPSPSLGTWSVKENRFE